MFGNKRDVTDIQKNEIKREKAKTARNFSEAFKYLVYICVPCMLIYIALGGIAGNKINLPGLNGVWEFFHGKVVEITTTSTHDLVDKIQKSQLNLVEYPYSGCFEEKDSDGDVKYYVYFTGKVKAGINVEDIKEDNIIVDEENKKITINLPEPVVEEPNVDQNKIEYIFLKSKYDDDDVHVDSYNKAVEIMREKANEDGNIKENARKAAKSFVQDLVKVLVNVDKDNYEVVVK